MNHPTEYTPAFRSRAVIDGESRSPIDLTSSFPWSAIAEIVATQSDGSKQAGSGCLIGPRTFLTAAHVVHPLGGSTAIHIEVSPGRIATATPHGTAVATQADVRVAERWVNVQDKEEDYAVIVIHDRLGEKLDAFGFGYYQDADLNGLQVTVAGYPLTPPGAPAPVRPVGTMWYERGPLGPPSPRKLVFDLDLTIGQSGGPVFVEVDGQYWVIGIANSGGAPNAAVRITPDVYKQLVEWRL